jgi:hypothetical protein
VKDVDPAPRRIRRAAIAFLAAAASGCAAAQ